jgi:hypothetical protein
MSKDYEVQYQFLENCRQNNGYSAGFLSGMMVVKDNRIDVSRQAIDITWDGDGSDRN